MFENLEKLSFICKHNQFSGRPKILNFPNLKELEIRIEDSKKSKVEPKIVAPKLEKLSMKFQTPTKDFLLNFPNLKILIFDNYLNDRNKFSLPELSSQLTSLDVDLMISEELKDFDVNFISFLSTQKSLKTLRLLSENFHNEIEFAVFNIKVESLTIIIPENFEKSKSSKLNTSIKELTLELYHKDSTQNALMNIEKIFQCCPNVEKLTINCEEENNESEILKIASTFLKKLKHLIIISGLGEFDEEIDLSSVESIFILFPMQVCEIESFMNLILSCKNLKKIHLKSDDGDFIDEVSVSSNNFIRILKTLKSLEEISVNFGFKLCKKVVDFILKEKLKLKTLKFEVDRDFYEDQKELLEKISKKTNIHCTIMKKM
jgi:hypothetical protein